MTGHTTADPKRPGRYYICLNGTLGICTSRRLNAVWIEGILTDMIRELAADDEFGATLLAELKRQAKARKQTSPARSKSLAEQIAKLGRQVERGTKNLLMAEPDDVQAASAMLSEWREQKNALEVELKALGASQKGSRASVDDLVNRAMKELGRLHEHLKAPASPEGKEAFKRLFDKVTVTWHDRPKGQRNYRVARVEIAAPEKLALLSDSVLVCRHSCLRRPPCDGRLRPRVSRGSGASQG